MISLHEPAGALECEPAKEFRRGGIVVIPNVVVNHLEVPQAFTGAGIERQQAIREEVGPVAVRAESLPADPGGLEYATVPPVVDAPVEPAVPAGGSVAVPSAKLMARPEPEGWGEAELPVLKSLEQFVS